MIGPVNVLLIILFLIVVPFILGLLLECYFEKIDGKMMLSRCFALGVSVMLAAFQLVSVPMIIKAAKFTTLLYAFSILLAALVIFSIFKNAKGIKEKLIKVASNIKANFLEYEKEQKILLLLALILIALQSSLLLVKMHTDTDDCRFLAESLEATERNTLLITHPITGEPLYEPIGEMRKDVSSPYPIFISALAVLTGTQPTVLAHLAFPVLLIPLAYAVLYMIGCYVLTDKKQLPLYMFILSVLILFSFESIYTWGYTMLAIIWQGRSIFSVIILPLVWYILMHIFSEDSLNIGIYIALFTVSMAASDLSGMGLMMTPLTGGAFALTYLIKYKKILRPIGIGICILPCLGYLAYYMLAW